MTDAAIKQGNADIRRCKRILHRLYEGAVDEIIFAFSPFLDTLLLLEEKAPQEGRREWLKKERRKVVTAMSPDITMLKVIRKVQRRAYRIAIAPMREIYKRNFIYIINEITKEIHLTADLLLDLWTEGLLNDYDELIEESELENPEDPEAQAISRWRESLYEESLTEQAARNLLHSVPGMKGDPRARIKKGVIDIVGRAERHTGRFIDNIDSHFTNKGREEAGKKIEEQFGEDVKKVWICTFQNSRDSHIKMHLQVRDVDEDFISGLGNVLRFPGDMLAPIEDWINCQCYIIVVPASMVDDNGKLIQTGVTDFTGKLLI